LLIEFDSFNLINCVFLIYSESSSGHKTCINGNLTRSEEFLASYCSVSYLMRCERLYYRKAAVVIPLFVNVNIASRDEIILDRKYDGFRLFYRICLDLISNFGTISEYEIRETRFVNSPVIESCWFVEHPNIEE
jgi:hypothetical protein